MSTPTLFTSRLIVRPLRVQDAEALHPMFHDPAAMRYWHSPIHPDVATTQAKLALWLRPNPDAHYWALCLREDERPIGVIYYLDTTVLSPGMGYFLHPAYWQHGLMTEAARAVLEYGFTQLDLDRVELWIQQDNVASQRLAHTLGFTRRGYFYRTLAFGLYRHEWDTTRPPAASLAQRFDDLYPVFVVDDVAATAEYYQRKLGFILEWMFGEPPNVGMVAHREWSRSGARIQLRRGRPISSRRRMLIVIEVGSDIDALYERYVDQGVEIRTPIVTRPWESREFVITDMNGYRLCFAGLPSLAS
ncbi:MAG: GNAT family N-acetyltransferase [Ktedonobacterales bacterium]